MIETIPQTLKNENHWVVWKNEKKNGKYTKIPYDAKTGNFAKSNDSATWATFDQARQAADDILGKYDGVGFMLYGSNLIGIDFDGVIDDGVPEPYVIDIVSHLGTPYCEITPSTTGLRVFIQGSQLPPGNRKFSAKKKGIEKYGAEIYSGSEGGRYLTVTGDRYSGEGIPPAQNLDIVHFLMSKFADDHFRRLWMGDASEYENDDSRVDLALLGLFMRAFNGEAEKAVRFFNASVPGHREKWHRKNAAGRYDYRELTIAKATSGLAMSKDTWRRFVDRPRKIIEFHTEFPERKRTPFDYAVQAHDGQFDGWFPLGSPSIIGGSSGSGKSTWMLDLCDKQSRGEDFYGHKTYGRRYLVLMLDRGRFSHVRTMRRMGFQVSDDGISDQIPIKRLQACVDGDASQQVIDKIEDYLKEQNVIPEIVFIEGIDMLVSDPSAMEVVTPFMHEMQMVSEHFHIALVGSCGAPKSKPKEGYQAKRDTIFGSAVWSRMSETIVTMQYPNGDDTDAHRVISILPRNAQSEKFDAEFSQGKLVISKKPIESGISTVQERAENWIQQYLQDGSKYQRDVEDAMKWEDFGKNAFRDAAAHLHKIGALSMTRNSKHQSIWTLMPIGSDCSPAEETKNVTIVEVHQNELH